MSPLHTILVAFVLILLQILGKDCVSPVGKNCVQNPRQMTAESPSACEEGRPAEAVQGGDGKQETLLRCELTPPLKTAPVCDPKDTL